MMAARTPPPLLDARLRFDKLPPEGRSLKVSADAAERAAIAARLGIESVENLKAELTATPLKGGIRLRGRLHAEVMQACVVSFVPVPEAIDEVIDRVFLQGRPDQSDLPAGAETFVDLEGEDLPDYFEGPEIDFSELLIETLSLALNPYPRAGDASLDMPDQSEAEGSSPFAALKGFKPSRD